MITTSKLSVEPDQAHLIEGDAEEVRQAELADVS